LRKSHGRWDCARQIKAKDDVAELGGGTGRPAVDPSPKHEPATNMSTNGEHDEVAGDKLQLVVVSLREGCDVGVVVDEHGDAELPLERVTERDVG
jgi:hypothetical protein